MLLGRKKKQDVPGLVTFVHVTNPHNTPSRLEHVEGKCPKKGYELTVTRVLGSIILVSMAKPSKKAAGAASLEIEPRSGKYYAEKERLIVTEVTQEERSL